MPDHRELFRRFDPLHALTADEGALYVDWQPRLGTDDVKPRLIGALSRTSTCSPTRTTTASGTTGTRCWAEYAAPG